MDWGKPKQDAAPKKSGMEMMLNSMGMGDVLEAAKALANAGTLEKILQFADQVEGINGRIERVETLLLRLVAKLEAGQSGDGKRIATDTDPANSGPDNVAGNGLVTFPGRYSADTGYSGTGADNRNAGDDVATDTRPAQSNGGQL
jgi:hypothetical protein